MADTEHLSKPKHPGGRPSKYTKTVCTRIIECGKDGMTVPEMADDLDVSIQTLYEWKGVHPEFSEAFTRAQESAEAYWAKNLRTGLKLPPSEFQGAANLKYMAQRFRGWSEKVHADVKDTPDDADTPDVRKEAREVAFMLARAAQKID